MTRLGNAKKGIKTADDKIIMLIYIAMFCSSGLGWYYIIRGVAWIIKNHFWDIIYFIHEFPANIIW